MSRKRQDSSPEGAIRLQDQGIACNILDQRKPTRLASAVEDFGLKQHDPASGGRREAERVQGNTKVDPGGGTRRSEPAPVFRKADILRGVFVDRGWEEVQGSATEADRTQS